MRADWFSALSRGQALAQGAEASQKESGAELQAVSQGLATAMLEARAGMANVARHEKNYKSLLKKHNQLLARTAA